MKKILILLTLVVSVLGFSTGAFALPPVCNSCTGTEIGRIFCPQGDQVTCSAFDYDSFNGTTARDGYCPIAASKSAVRYKAIFNICNCVESSKFILGHKMGVRMTILTKSTINDAWSTGENGAYWSGIGTDGADIRFQAFADTEEACGAQAYSTRFGPGNYLKSDLTTIVLPGALSTGTVCTIPTSAQATVIYTNKMTGGYTLSDADLDVLGNLKSRWAIDIPPIRIDPAVLRAGEYIGVRIELVDFTAGGICQLCPSLCDCIITVAQVCCTSTATYGNCFYPYFTSLTNDMNVGDWWNGIAIKNTSSNSGTARLEARNSEGHLYTATQVIPGNGMVTKMLWDFTWEPATGSPAYEPRNRVSVNVVGTNFVADGFALIGQHTDNGDSMGYLCRKY